MSLKALEGVANLHFPTLHKLRHFSKRFNWNLQQFFNQRVVFIHRAFINIVVSCMEFSPVSAIKLCNGKWKKNGCILLCGWVHIKIFSRISLRFLEFPVHRSGWTDISKFTLKSMKSHFIYDLRHDFCRHFYRHERLPNEVESYWKSLWWPLWSTTMEKIWRPLQVIIGLTRSINWNQWE